MSGRSTPRNKPEVPLAMPPPAQEQKSRSWLFFLFQQKPLLDRIHPLAVQPLSEFRRDQVLAVLEDMDCRELGALAKVAKYFSEPSKTPAGLIEEALTIAHPLEVIMRQIQKVCFEQKLQEDPTGKVWIITMNMLKEFAGAGMKAAAAQEAVEAAQREPSAALSPPTPKRATEEKSPPPSAPTQVPMAAAAPEPERPQRPAAIEAVKALAQRVTPKRTRHTKPAAEEPAERTVDSEKTTEDLQRLKNEQKELKDALKHQASTMDKMIQQQVQLQAQLQQLLVGAPRSSAAAATAERQSSRDTSEDSRSTGTGTAKDARAGFSNPRVLCDTSRWWQILNDPSADKMGWTPLALRQALTDAFVAPIRDHTTFTFKLQVELVEILTMFARSMIDVEKNPQGEEALQRIVDLLKRNEVFENHGVEAAEAFQRHMLTTHKQPAAWKEALKFALKAKKEKDDDKKPKPKSGGNYVPRDVWNTLTEEQKKAILEKRRR